jgi:large subunit ribosomal protein L18Ae
MVKYTPDTTKSVHHFLVVGRKKPTEKSTNEKIYKMRIFAKDQVHAKSKFWYFLRRMNKVKSANGEILACSEVYKHIY